MLSDFPGALLMGKVLKILDATAIKADHVAFSVQWAG
jgi:hypothetical protein